MHAPDNGSSLDHRSGTHDAVSYTHLTNEIKADDARVTSIIESMATAYEDPKEVIEYYQQNEQMLNGVRNLAIEDQAIDLILSKAQVTEKEVAFDEVINKSGAAA